MLVNFRYTETDASISSYLVVTSNFNLNIFKFE